MVLQNERFRFIWRVTAAHTIAYFVAGVIAMNALNYTELFPRLLIMRPITDPIIALGAGLQVIRGVLIALILLPVYKVLTEGKYGFLKLGLLLLGLSVLSTFAAASGSFEGFIYTTIPVSEQIVGYTEAVIWILLFIGIFAAFYMFEKKAITILSIVCVVLIVLMSVMGYLVRLNIIQT
ncbi:MAG: hypothetical protein LBE56_08330 [Tannerella sp.]|jgi:hypothetical protein|nr:hypothetical protein [Tannerella sp.]